MSEQEKKEGKGSHGLGDQSYVLVGMMQAIKSGNQSMQECFMNKAKKLGIKIDLSAKGGC